MEVVAEYFARATVVIALRLLSQPRRYPWQGPQRARSVRFFHQATAKVVFDSIVEKLWRTAARVAAVPVTPSSFARRRNSALLAGHLDSN